MLFLYDVSNMFGNNKYIFMFNINFYLEQIYVYL